jgi:hypothetical protein
MTSTERLAFAKARALGVDIAIVDFPKWVHVVPAEDIKEGSVTFIATPLASLEHAPKYQTIEACRVGARALFHLYGKTVQAIWMLSHANTDWGGYFINCAATIDVGLYDTDAVRVEEVPC